MYLGWLLNLETDVSAYFSSDSEMIKIYLKTFKHICTSMINLSEILHTQFNYKVAIYSLFTDNQDTKL